MTPNYHGNWIPTGRNQSIDNAFDILNKIESRNLYKHVGTIVTKKKLKVDLNEFDLWFLDETLAYFDILHNLYLLLILLEIIYPFLKYMTIMLIP